MKLTIEKFSTIFCFGHCGLSTDEEDLCFSIREFKDLEYDEIFDSIQMLSCMYSKQFMEAVVKIFITDYRNNFASKKKFMCFVLSRCMILSETPTLFSFLLICVFVNTVICGVFVPLDLECFTVAKTASKCLTAAFYRKYVDFFEEENGFEGLAHYCEKLNETLLYSSDEDSDSESERKSLNLEGFALPNTDDVIGLLHSLKDINEEDFFLTDFEKKLLYEKDILLLDIDLPEDIFLQLHDSAESSEIKKLEIAMEQLNIESDYILERFNDICMLCKDNCYKHVILAAKELKVDE